MPRRTTLFQRAVYFTKQHLADATTESITESRMLRDRATQADREVDIVLVGKVGEYEATISIECNERARKADVTWVEMMHGKHATLPTSRLILVSQAGFTAAAEQKAVYFGYTAITPESPTDSTLHAVIADLRRLMIAAFDIGMDAAYLHVPDLSDEPLQVENDYAIHDSAGNATGVTSFLERLQNSVIPTLADEPITDTWRQYKSEMTAKEESSNRFYLYRDPPGRFIEIAKVTLFGRIRAKEGGY